MSLTKSHIAANIQKKFGYSTKVSHAILDLVIEEIKHRLEMGESVKINGFGKWEVHNKKKRLGRNPANGEAMEIAARHIIAFRPSQSLRKTINSTISAYSHSTPSQTQTEQNPS